MLENITHLFLSANNIKTCIGGIERDSGLVTVIASHQKDFS